MAKNTAQKQAFNALGNILSPKATTSNETVTTEQPKAEKKQITNDSEFVRNTYMVRETYKTKLKIASARSNMPLQNIMDEAIGAWIANFEKQNGEIAI